MLNKDNNNNQYVEGNSRVRLVMFAFLGFWGLIGYLLKQIMEKKIEQVKTPSNTKMALNELINIFTNYLIIPLFIFCIIQGIYFLRLGIKTMKAGVYPPPGVNMPFKTRINRGIKAKIAGIACLVVGLGGFVIFPLLMILRHEIFRHI